jgi:hypothetical protein
MRKNFFLIIATFLFSATTIAQIPHLFKYQGLARDSSGNPISNDTIALRISIHQGTPTGTVVYQETHNPITNLFGSFSINIGGGTVVIGVFSTIPWNRYNYFQEVEMDVSGGTNFVSMGTSQYLTVPYSLATDSARNGIAPFFIKNTSSGSDTAAVAIIAIANGNAPAVYIKNNGSGESLMVDGNAIINGTVTINGSVLTSGFSNFQVFNSSGSFTVPVGVTKLMVELWGAGGGGGGSGGGGYSNSGGTGGGGGGGGYVKDIITVTPGQSIPVTVGLGGSGGSGGASCGINCSGQPGSDGTGGGSSIFSSANAQGGDDGAGGGGGQNGSPGTNGSGGFGGNAPGIFGVVGQSGHNGSAFGFGGSSPNGGFGGNPGGDKTPGGGGAGGVGSYNNGNAGSSGGNGRVVVWW